MSLKLNMQSSLFKIAVFSLILFVIFFSSLKIYLFKTFQEKSNQEVKNTKYDNVNYRGKIIYRKMSPDHQGVVNMYERPRKNNETEDEYNEYLVNQYLITVKKSEDIKELDIFITDYQTGYPYWLDNNYIYLTAGCGSSCQGLRLIDTRNKESRLGVLGYSSSNGAWETYFRDWFGKEFQLKGLVKEIRSENFENEFYLIFNMEDDKGQFLPAKKFLFTGNSLKAL